MQRTITPRAQVILDQAKDILAVHGLSLEHVVRIANALHIAKSMDLKPNVQWHEATYKMLCSLWPTQHIPDYWKQRWLVPLPKTDELTSIEDLRPICLLEIFRKL